ncbi:MAG: ABC transporter substrate-binding protein [Anaerolineales bacterium]|nr:ABC transporter substrate-binding protein [Anaerolineales bacterium]
MSREQDPLDSDLRRVMRERWDRQPVPHDLSTSVSSRLRRTTMRQKLSRFAGAAVGLGLLAALAIFFAAVLNRPPVEPAVTPILVTKVQTTPVTEIVPVIVETRKQFTEPHPILGDVRVRRAIAHCTDRAALVKSVYPWVEDAAPFVADSFLPRDHWAYTDDLSRYPFDPSQGAALLEEAGWRLPEGATYRVNANGDELALTLTTTNAQFRQTWAAVWEAQMQACGLRIVRFHTPAAWFFGDSTGLSRRDFEVAAFAWMTGGDPGPGGRTLYACDSIPRPDNGWRGQNYTGWCNPAADAAIRTATTALDRETRRAAYAIFQREWTRDVPTLPLYFRPAYFAVNAALENFKVDGSEHIHTWNAAEWRIPGKDTIVIGEDGEPASLARLETAYVAQVLRTLIAGADYTHFGYEYQPVMLTRIPTLESGAAVSNNVSVAEGAAVVDALGEAAELRPGVRVRNADGDEVTFTGEPLTLRQLTVTYEFVSGLTWSDGTPVSRADYELAYRIECDPEMGQREFLNANPRCAQIAGVDFLSDTAYRVTYKPGFEDPEYFLPPFGREPAHRVISDGRRLADVSAAEWADLREVAVDPWGVGPYRMVEWVFGQRMRLEANPHYFAGPVATPSIVVRFMEHEAVINALLAGEVDVLDSETLVGEDLLNFPLKEAQAAGKIRLVTPPSPTWEHLDFALFQR